MSSRLRKIARVFLLWILYKNYLQSRKRKSRRIPLITGTQQTFHILNDYTGREFLYEARMNKESFNIFVTLLRTMGLSSNRTISVEEKTLVFMRALAGKDIQESANKFSRSVSTVHNVLHEVVEIVSSNADVFIVSFCHETHPNISEDDRFSHYFHNCIGAVDGSHIPVHVPSIQCAPFRNRKGYLSTNVCAIVDFNCLFTHVNVGWSGSASDPQVFNDSCTKGLAIPADKYLLADAGYGLCEKLLTPYRGVRYHLKEWNAALEVGQYPATKEELFNLRHASLRNIIERAFGILKHRFPLLTGTHPFHYPFQVKLFLCCFCMHTFVRSNQTDCDEFDNYVDENNNNENAALMNHVYIDFYDNAHANEWRDNIAMTMWTDQNN